MKINKRTVDVILVMLVLLATVLPLFIAKQMIIVSLSFLSIRIIFSKDLFFYSKYKIIIFLLFLPGIFAAIYTAPEHIIRYFGILLLVLGFPFSSFNIKHSSIIFLSSLVLIYLIVTQLLLLHGNQVLMNFRDLAYDYDPVNAHKSYGTTSNIFENAIDFSYWKIRAGGLYSNPNTLAAVVLLFFFIFDISWKFNIQKIGYNKKIWKSFIYLAMFSLVLMSLMQTKSKTYLITFLVYLIFQHLNIIDIIRLKVKTKLILPLFLSVGILSLFFEKIINNFFQGGSVNIKYSILFDYLKDASFFNIFFGGVFDVYFDTEYGYWIGASGLAGIIAFYIFYKMVYRFSNQSKAILIALICSSFGSSLFYSLLLVSILIPMFIVLLSSEKINQ